jgi:hypothetical protein
MRVLLDMTKNRKMHDEIYYAAPILTIYAMYKFAFRDKFNKLKPILDTVVGLNEELFNRVVQDLTNDQKQ